MGQFARIRRNCSTDVEFAHQAAELTKRFKMRGYPHRVISRAYQRAKMKPRSQLLKAKTKTEDNSIRYITTFNNQWGQLRGILTRNWNILVNDARVEKHIPARPQLVARRAKNLRDYLSHSHFERPTTSLGRGVRLIGTYPCGNCSICHTLIAKNSFTNPSDSREIALKEYINCRTRNVIYGLRCGCPKLYVGQTSQELRKRVQQHVSTITLAQRDLDLGKKLTPVATHFLQKHRVANADIALFKHEYHRGICSSFTLSTPRGVFRYQVDIYTNGGAIPSICGQMGTSFHSATQTAPVEGTTRMANTDVSASGLPRPPSSLF